MSSHNASLGLRRLRLNRHIRELTREVHVTPGQFIQPLFVVEGLDAREPVPGLPDVYRETPASLLDQITADLQAGVSKFILFGVPAQQSHARFRFRFYRRTRSPPSMTDLATGYGSPSTCACVQQRRTATAAS